MTETTRRVNVTLTIPTDADMNGLLADMLIVAREKGYSVESGHVNTFDLAEDDADEPHVQIVVDAKGGITGTWVDNPDRADEFARNTSAVVVSLPIESDHRGEEAARYDR